jgi:hypothetical protein
LRHHLSFLFEINYRVKISPETHIVWGFPPNELGIRSTAESECGCIDQCKRVRIRRGAEKIGIRFSQGYTANSQFAYGRTGKNSPVLCYLKDVEPLDDIGRFLASLRFEYRSKLDQLGIEICSSK